MTTINFSNGKSVNFDGNPTSQDILDVAQKLGITNNVQTPTTAAAPTPGLGQLDAAQVQQGAAKIQSSIAQGAAKMQASPDLTPGMGVVPATQAEAGKVGNLLETGLGTAAGASQAIAAPLTATIQKVISALGINTTPGKGSPAEAIANKVGAWAAAHPEAATNLTDALTVGGTALADVGGIKNPLNTDMGTVADIPKNAIAAAQAVPGEVKTADSLIQGGADKLNQTIGTTQADRATAKIADLIAPKLDKAEANAALLSGRVTRTPQGGLRQWIFGDRPDSVATSEMVNKATQVIQNNIPDATKLSDVQLHGALSEKTTEIAQKLAPEMEKVPVTPEASKSLVDEWNQVKAAQTTEPEFDNFPGSVKAQAKFERYLGSVTDSGLTPEETNQNKVFDQFGVGSKVESKSDVTLNDVWQARKDYDASIPANVKGASIASHPNLAWQKTMWLQNRDVFNRLIESAKGGLGETAQNAFSDMTSMYNAQQNIASKLKLDINGTRGAVGHIGASLAKWGIRGGAAALGAGTIYEAMH